MPSEVSQRADFSIIRYAQVWEDADVLLAGLDVQPGQTVVSIASAGDNALALLTRRPARVVALDLSAAQLACLALRVAAFRELTHPELLELIGSTPSARRSALYARCRPLLAPAERAFWDAQGSAIDRGIGALGKFERYFELFRKRVLPWVHGRRRVAELLTPKSLDERRAFYEARWNHRRWRWLFRVFFSRAVMGRLGRDPSFFQYVEGRVADRILARTHHALTELDPVENPYLQWILTGRHPSALPLALRPEHFDTIRDHLDRLEWHAAPIEEFLAGQTNAVDHFNLSDIFEYMSPAAYERLLTEIVRAGRPGGRLAYWNMLAPRSRPAHMADRLRPLSDRAQALHLADKAFFYSAFVLEEIV